MTYPFIQKLQCVLLAILPLAACANTPTPSHSEPAVTGNIIAKVGFENAAYNAGDAYDRVVQSLDWTLTQNPSRMHAGTARITNDAAHNGQRSLEIRYAPNLQAVKQAAWELPVARRYTLSYAVRFADDFVFNGQGKTEDKSNGGKLPGLAGRGENGQFCSGGKDCSDGGGFSARLMWRTNGQAMLYLYDHQKSIAGHEYGENIVFKNSAYFRPGKWHHIRQTVTLNTLGNSDGRIDMWMDGQKVVTLLDRKIVAKNERIDAIMFSTFFGGNSQAWFPATEQTAYFDDFIVRR